jgi:hypothetical protein
MYEIRAVTCVVYFFIFFCNRVCVTERDCVRVCSCVCVRACVRACVRVSYIRIDKYIYATDDSICIHVHTYDPISNRSYHMISAISVSWIVIQADIMQALQTCCCVSLAQAIHATCTTLLTHSLHSLYTKNRYFFLDLSDIWANAQE